MRDDGSDDGGDPLIVGRPTAICVTCCIFVGNGDCSLSANASLFNDCLSSKTASVAIKCLSSGPNGQDMYKFFWFESRNPQVRYQRLGYTDEFHTSAALRYKHTKKRIS